jgi:hypothetical protein
MRKNVKRLLGAGLVGGAAYAAWRAWNASQATDRPKVAWEPSPFPYPPVPRVASSPAPTTTDEASPDGFVEPNSDGTCPVGHPIKGKLASGIYHVPGGANYERTKPDRCYADETAAAADGLRRSKA